MLTVRRLQGPWIYKDPPPVLPQTEPQSEDEDTTITPLFPNADSSLGIGDANVWMDNRENRV
jgi:hypothetical protein